MPFLPHTEQDIREMLATIGIKTTDALFAEIPAKLKISGLKDILPALNEMEISRLMNERACCDQTGHLCFIGAGAYEHHIPALIWEIASRGEYMTAYTPYQAEASQGTLQTIYEYQTMIANLTGMDVSNASMYDGASALAEAALMAVRANRNSKSKKVLMPKSVHPAYRLTAKTMAAPQGVEFIELAHCGEFGNTLLSEVEKYSGHDIAALVIPQPNFFGVLEEVDALTDWAHKNKALVIALVNPMAIALLKEPGAWGEKGADITIGDGQPLGIPLASGGPYFGFMACKEEHMRNMPGRIIGKTTDANGKVGYVLNMQAREQHIRRAKATSNICSNQGLMATASTMYMSVMGAEGLRKVAIASHNNAHNLQKQLQGIKGITSVFKGPMFHEFVIRLNHPVAKVLDNMLNLGIQGGYDLSKYYPELGNALLVCTTETKTEDDLAAYVSAIREVEGKL
jgi:glycine dehydrogenase subunit 1